MSNHELTAPFVIKDLPGHDDKKKKYVSTSLAHRFHQAQINFERQKKGLRLLPLFEAFAQ